MHCVDVIHEMILSIQNYLVNVLHSSEIKVRFTSGLLGWRTIAKGTQVIYVCKGDMLAHTMVVLACS